MVTNKKRDIIDDIMMAGTERLKLKPKRLHQSGKLGNTLQITIDSEIKKLHDLQPGQVIPSESQQYDPVEGCLKIYFPKRNLLEKDVDLINAILQNKRRITKAALFFEFAQGTRDKYHYDRLKNALERLSNLGKIRIKDGEIFV